MLMALEISGGGRDLLSQRIGRSGRRGLASRFEMNHRVGARQRLALGGSSEVGENLRILVEQLLDIVPRQNLDRRDAVFAVGAVEIEQRTLQAFWLGGRGRDHKASDWKLQARGPVHGVLDLGNRQLAARGPQVALDGGESRTAADLDQVDSLFGAIRIAETLELRELPMSPQKLQTESFELVGTSGQRISGSEFCHSVTFPNTLSGMEEAPRTP